MTVAFDDWVALCELKARYCRLLDGKDWAGLAAQFTPDVVIDATASGGPRMVGRDAAVARVRGSLETAVTMHRVAMPEMTVAGDTADVIWAMRDQLVWANGRRVDGAGHYHERCVRQDGVWRIAESRLTRLYVDMRLPDAERDA